MRNIFKVVVTAFLIRSNSGFLCTTRSIGTKKNSSIHNLFLSKKRNYDQQKLFEKYVPKGYNQELYVKYLNDCNTKLLFAVGPAGTGKTLFACNEAIKQLKNGDINKIILTRPVVARGRRHRIFTR